MTTTPLAAWRMQRRTTTALPSGLEVVLQRVTLIDLAARGAIPAPLHGQVQALIAQASDGVNPTLDLAQLPAQMELINVVVRAALVVPAIADEADETHLTIEELTFEDRMAIFTWAQGGAAALAPFPGAAPGAGAGAAPGGDDLRPAAKRPAARAVDGLRS